MIAKRPCVSETTERVRSMSAGLDASTVTPGITAPEVSFTTPDRPLCAYNAAGSRTKPSGASNSDFVNAQRSMVTSL